MDRTHQPLSVADDTPRIAGFAMTGKQHAAVEMGQVEHRIRLCNFWRIASDSCLLELGCGQGTCTTVLAEAVGPHGFIDAVDPAPLDYGAPVTLGEAQAYISGGPLGSRITWHNECLDTLLQRHQTQTWDAAVLAHCIWYLAAPEALDATLGLLRGRAPVLLVAEYALSATEPHAVPHVLAAMARAMLEAHNEASTANIRCLLGPDHIKRSAVAQGWHLDAEAIITPGEALLDGSWETASVTDADFVRDVAVHVQSTLTQSWLRSSHEAVKAAQARLDGRRVRTMDVWVARFTASA
ncbi:hypothetical protein CDD81_4269 [Ophiocordyceps australis]|uniref:Methyltransferase domain-containing protein n=1 Tax=Ophiocordyceps australis TaxID=1399860 RepID=A0A2C5X713_9HYPO|nr:hypothetical protein CDD81_4269 [Ophiocordyceps australis]